jgi:hypothetical protein
MEYQSLVLTRPMQLGKTTLFSLVELVFSKNERCPDGLAYKPPAELKNSCFVLRVDFGTVNADRDGTTTWEEVGRKFDKDVRIIIDQAVEEFLDANANVALEYRSTPVASDSHSGHLLEKLVRAVKKTDGKDAVLFILVDEYDQPMREILLDMLSSGSRAGADNILSMETRLKNVYPEYTGFFKGCKTISGILANTKTWVTGITPLALPLLSGFHPDVLSFNSALADVVGLCDGDVDRMLDQVHTYNPFKDDTEKSSVRDAIRYHYNGLLFLSGSGLYHTRLVNCVMENLLRDFERKQWLKNLSEPMSNVLVEKCPASVFNAVAIAPNLRPAVSTLVATGEVSGYKLNPGLSLSSLLGDKVVIDDYLTLLVHLGVLSVSVHPSGIDHIFKISSAAYRLQHLEALLVILKSSIGELFKCKTLQDVYEKGEDCIMDFMTTLTATSMSSLVDWAGLQDNNNIMELQLQGFMVGELHDVLFGVTIYQETVLPTLKRTDITLKGKHVLVILELKKINGSEPPEEAQKGKYHKQLRGYVKTRNQMEAKGKKRPVAGFIVVLYDNGQHYIVEKLTER